MVTRRLLLAASLFATLTVAAARGADGDDAVPKQKTTAEALLKGAEIKFATAETNDLLVYGAFPEAKVKTFATAAQKTYDSGAKILGVKSDEKLWIGKLTVYILADGKQSRTILQAIDKKVVDRRETSRISPRGETPFVALPLELGAKATDALMSAEVSEAIGAATLRAKIGGTSPPAWLMGGFGRLAYVRADGPTSARATAHKQKVKALLTKSRGMAFKWWAIEKDEAGPDGELLATSLVEYLAFGPSADKFSALVTALKPTENGMSPSFSQALQAIEWPADMFDATWQKWVATGK